MDDQQWRRVCCPRCPRCKRELVTGRCVGCKLVTTRKRDVVAQREPVDLANLITPASRKKSGGRKKTTHDPAALWAFCARGQHDNCSGGPVLVQPAALTSGKVRVGTKRANRDHPLVRDFVCPCECHRRTT